jgi:hypothetical protein
VSVPDRIDVTIAVPAPTAANSAAAARQRRAVEQAVATIQALFDQSTPEELAAFARYVGRALRPPPDAAPDQSAATRRALVVELAGGRTYSAPEQAALETAALVRGFRYRQELLRGSLTAPEVAELLGTSRQTPHDRAKSGTLLAVLDRGALRFPSWQFEPSGPDGVMPGLPVVLQALEVSPLAKVSWFVQPNPYLERRTPLAALKAGEVERLVGLARAVGAH